jgi:hypothetical protein
MYVQSMYMKCITNLILDLAQNNVTPQPGFPAGIHQIKYKQINVFPFIDSLFPGT